MGSSVSGGSSTVQMNFLLLQPLPVLDAGTESALVLHKRDAVLS